MHIKVYLLGVIRGFTNLKHKSESSAKKSGTILMLCFFYLYFKEWFMHFVLTQRCFCCLPERSINQINILVLEYFSTVQTFYFLYVYRINCTISHKFLAYALLSASFCQTYFIIVMHIHGRVFFRHSKNIFQMISFLLMKGHGQGVLII